MNDERYEVARKRVIQKLILRATFVFNVIFFGLVTLLLSRQGINTESDRLGVVFFVLIFGSALAVHGALAFNLFGLISPLINRLTQRELEQIRLAEKPKRREFELGEDGEMIEIDEEIAPVTAKHKSGG